MKNRDSQSGWRAVLENACERNHTEVGTFKQDRSRRRSEEILAAAVRVFARDGIARARISDIAAEAGMPVPSIYDYYKSKEELAYAVPMRRQTEFFAEFRKAAAKMDTTREKLGHFLWLTTDFARRHPDWARVLYLEVWPSVWIKDSDIRDVLDDYGRIIVGMIREGAERGEWPAVPDPYPLTTIFIGAINQVITVWLLYRRPRNLATGSRQMVDQMMELLTLRKGAGASLARPAKTAKTPRTTARGKTAVG
jgi:AcrR family transcriptional regulator